MDSPRTTTANAMTMIVTMSVIMTETATEIMIGTTIASCAIATMTATTAASFVPTTLQHPRERSTARKSAGATATCLRDRPKKPAVRAQSVITITIQLWCTMIVTVITIATGGGAMWFPHMRQRRGPTRESGQRARRRAQHRDRLREIPCGPCG